MWFPILSALWRFRSERRTARRASSNARLALESLEDRSVPAFLAPVTSPGGGILAVADFNRDGRSDLAVVKGIVESSAPTTSGWTVSSVTLNHKSSVSVNLSDGDGTFQTSATLKGLHGYYLGSVTTRDANGDGNLDVVVTATARRYEKITSTVFSVTFYQNVWLGKGDGTFGEVSITSTSLLGPIPPGATWSMFPTADFNHDGLTDKTSISKYTDNLSVFLATTSGIVQRSDYLVGPTPSLLYVGDFNGDGWTDLLVVNSLASGNPTTSVLFNDGIW